MTIIMAQPAIMAATSNNLQRPIMPASLRSRVPVLPALYHRSSSPANKRHLRGHHGDELDVYVERQSCHVDHGSSDVLGIDCRLDDAGTVSLERACLERFYKREKRRTPGDFCSL